ncbi:GntR family transcriptional regulator [Hoeflea sp.]|uniref:GntR family transcriptional regulator n=1 Tax=Hoeflea sp. TaxID=1940281 RepID=UPI00198EC681|nr:GntR family transcriptional regulator [Hoeflea sp.]MBC7285300.1 GntR family transcriptional regulator [Hoeflea sp.]
MNTVAEFEPKTTAFEKVEEELRNRIISGQLPGGAKLHVDSLRREFDVSTSTIREALSRLLACSLVVSQPNIGFSVAPLGRNDCLAAANARDLLEVAALRDSLANRSDAWEAALAGAFHMLARADRRFLLEGDASAEGEWGRRNQAFHEAMVGASQNRYLLDFRRSINFNWDRYRALLPKVSHSATHVPDQHKALFESAVDGRVEDCVSVMRDHISTTVRLVIDHLPDA